MRKTRPYDHRLRELVRRTGDVRIATDLGVPRSTGMGWLRADQQAVVSLDVLDLDHTERVPCKNPKPIFTSADRK